MQQVTLKTCQVCCDHRKKFTKSQTSFSHFIQSEDFKVKCKYSSALCNVCRRQPIQMSSNPCSIEISENPKSFIIPTEKDFAL